MLYDILLPVFEILQREYDDLYRCSLVNRDFNEIATKFLYSEVVLSPLFRPVLDLKDQNGPSVSIEYIPHYLLLNLWSEGWPIGIVVSSWKCGTCPDT